MKSLKGLKKAVAEYNKYTYNADWNALMYLDPNTGRIWTNVEYGNSWAVYRDPEIICLNNFIESGMFEYGVANEERIKKFCREQYNFKAWGEKE